MPLKQKILASMMHLLSLLLTFFLPLAVLLFVRKRNCYLSSHAKEGLNLHFTFLPIFIFIRITAEIWPYAGTASMALIGFETVLIARAAYFTLTDRPFSYPVIRFFKVQGDASHAA
ncbi:DUF4870 domain-containing protein [Terribacillus saccharophilus]|uniref:DUF4870 domain-containing protein n=1 Tax=Terribacillus saccharophilus TaxID=361277 RepID=A0ABX4GZ94_9BACI|nr:DUF4870 domain-containing protein [Terribacillus saccharophilus]PAD35654.1 hypothetical protein CHH56_08080 [Terribacillus saccharophilus]PAD96623.1 hypothetical protein CHH50_08480 [Terribacillus saccharophilus]PAE00199.1 hypothetical protein CHH48_09385 [Terribacillus saccharophilus]